VVNRLPNLKLLLTTGPRNASIDVQACQARGILVAGTNTGGAPGSGPDSTTQHSVALILALARNIPQDDAAVKSGGWQTKDAMGCELFLELFFYCSSTFRSIMAPWIISKKFLTFLNHLQTTLNIAKTDPERCSVRENIRHRRFG
jgi:hypothetical protein